MLNNNIIRLIEEGVNDQSELLSKLRDLGHELTQSSISRKLKDLGISKLHGRYQRLHILSKETKISFVDPNMLVINMAPGHAGAMAAKIDQQLIARYPEFIGSIAGDDTIFLAINLNEKDSVWAIEKVREVI